MTRHLSLHHESWPIAGSFAISRGVKTSADVILVEIQEGEHIGRAECVPYARYGETPVSVEQQIRSLEGQVSAGLQNDELQNLLPAGAARNALDCALHDLTAKIAGRRIWDLLAQPAPGPQITAYTLSLDSPEKMELAAQRSAARPLLKVKLGGQGDAERMRAVRRGAPDAEIIVDANEAWGPDNIENLLNVAATEQISLIEQPLHADQDAILAKIEHIVPICADESCHDRHSLEGILDLYDFINIKIDKTGGLTEALALSESARSKGMGLMIGCMLGTSLAMAPALLLAKHASYVDLDGPLLLQRDRPVALDYAEGMVFPASVELWG